MYKKLLVAADGSEHSFRAAVQALELAKLIPDSAVEVVYVVDSETSKRDAIHHVDAMEIEQKRKEKTIEIEKKAKDAGVAYEMKVLRGEPGPTIVKYANENEFDLVVIGSRGLNALQEMVLGSVSHKVAKRVQCPVLIVK